MDTQEKKLFAVEVEIKPLADSGLEEANGAVVTIYIPSLCLESAIAEAKTFMADEPYRIVELRCVALIDLSEWEDDEGAELNKNDLLEILATDEARFGVFYAF